MRRPLVIYGAGGHAREMREVVRDLVADGAAWELIGWASDDATAGQSLDGLPVLTWMAWRAHRPSVLVAVGHPDTRRRIVRTINPDVADFPAIVHPSCRIGARVVHGVGLQAAANAQVTVDARLGDFVLLNRGVQVSHDDEIGSYVTLNPLVSLSGNVHVGDRTQMGTGAVAIPGVRVGARVTVGAGTVLIRDVPDGATVVGNPGRIVCVVPEAGGSDA